MGTKFTFQGSDSPFIDLARHDDWAMAYFNGYTFPLIRLTHLHRPPMGPLRDSGLEAAIRPVWGDDSTRPFASVRFNRQFTIFECLGLCFCTMSVSE